MKVLKYTANGLTYYEVTRLAKRKMIFAQKSPVMQKKYRYRGIGAGCPRVASHYLSRLPILCCFKCISSPLLRKDACFQ